MSSTTAKKRKRDDDSVSLSQCLSTLRYHTAAPSAIGQLQKAVRELRRGADERSEEKSAFAHELQDHISRQSGLSGLEVALSNAAAVRGRLICKLTHTGERQHSIGADPRAVRFSSVHRAADTLSGSGRHRQVIDITCSSRDSHQVTRTRSTWSDRCGLTSARCHRPS